MRTAKYSQNQLSSKTRRQGLPEPPARKSGIYIYWVSLEPGLTLGYRPRRPQPGDWIVRVQTGRSENDAPKYMQKVLGLADDDRPGDDRLTFHGASALAPKAAQEMTRPQPDQPLIPLTVRAAVDDYMEHLETNKGITAREESEQRMAKHLFNHPLAKTLVSKLTSKNLREWHRGIVRNEGDEKQIRASKNTANRILNILRAALNHAFTGGSDSIPSDEAWRRLRPFANTGTQRKDHFTIEETLKLIDAAMIDPPFAHLLEAGFLTGARHGELTALNVADFNPELAQLDVKGGKTGSRIVSLTIEAVNFFVRMSRGQEKEAPLLRDGNGDRWGKSMQHRRIKAALKKAELPTTATYYALRHSHISRALEAGMPVSSIAENCGTSAAMIERHYKHLLQKRHREMVEKYVPTLRVGLRAV